MDVETTVAEDYFRINIYFKVLDSIIVNLKKRFSKENLSLAVGVDEFIKLNYDGSTQFINYYKVFLILLEILLFHKYSVGTNLLYKIINIMIIL